MAKKSNNRGTSVTPAITLPAPPPDTSAQEAEKKNIETQQENLRNNISDNDAKIDRLNAAERKLRSYASEIETLYHDFLNVYNEDVAWKGEKSNKYHDYAVTEFFVKYSDYLNKSLDFLEDIKKKVKDLKKENKDFQSQIQNLSTKWNSLDAEINALLNS